MLGGGTSLTLESLDLNDSGTMEAFTGGTKTEMIDRLVQRQDQCELATSVTNGACVIKSALIPYTQHLTLFMLLKYIMHMS